jgi:hypothetical protein
VSKSLGLSVPARQKPNNKSFSTRPKKVEAWLASLPKANLGETARLIYKLLQETNKYDIPHKERCQFLEQLRETAHYVTNAMRKHFFGITYPLPQKNQKIAAATREIQLAMATGYKIALEDALKCNILFQEKKHLALLTHRAISYTSRMLVTSYQIYAAPPENTWKELNLMYRLADEKKLLTISIADFYLFLEEKSTIETEYMRAVLLSLSSPYQLRQGEVGKIFNSLERFAQDVELTPYQGKQHASPQGLFALNIENGHQPGILQQVLTADNADSLRVINTDILTNRLRREIIETEDVVTSTITSLDMGRPDLSHDLLRRLLTSWALESHRTFPRNSKREEVHVTTGLSAIHLSLNQARPDLKQDQSKEFIRSAEYETSSVENVTDEKPDVWNMVYPTGSAAQLTQIVTEELEQNTKKVQPVDAKLSATETKLSEKLNTGKVNEYLDNWVIINESANGYCLKYNADGEARAQVGELVGVRRRISNHSWKWGIGVIRWLKFSIQRELELGIEMLNPDAAAIGMRPAIDDDMLDLQRTLLLPSITAINQPATLVTGPAPWRIGNKLVLNILGQNFNVILTHQVQNTGLFAQFQFEFLDKTAKKEKIKPQGSNRDQDFSQVWSSI